MISPTDASRSNSSVPDWVLEVLVSPEGRELVARQGCLVDQVDGTEFPVAEGIPDLRPKLPAAEGFDYHSHYQLDAELFDYFEEHSGEHAHEERRVHEAVTSFVRPGDKTILDVGCGSAWVAEAFLKQGKRVCSMDISTPNPAEALRRFPSPNHAGLVADVLNLPIKHGSFDAIIASEIIEHVIDPKLFVEKLFAALKPGGRLIVSTPYKERLRYVLCVHCNQKTPVHGHLHSFDEKRLLSFAPHGAKTMWKTFGNKALHHLRTYPLMKHLPYKAWLAADALANKAIKAPGHIVVVYEK
jgi:2-polyprenyl-3-methyl-5-hydroxy-6-metoxy-1,4-benzoquinol methylase